MPLMKLIVGFFIILVVSCQSQYIAQQDYYVDSSRPSVSFDSRVQFLILHYTAVNEEESFKILTQPQWPVSSHYLVTEHPQLKEGKPVVYQLVSEIKRAWHAGLSSWGNYKNINPASVGIEIVNLGYVDKDGKDPSRKIDLDKMSVDKKDLLFFEERYWFSFPPEQINAVIALSQDIVLRHQISPEHVLGHMDISPLRKSDPGPLFPWKQFYDAGVGAWYEEDVFKKYVNNRPLDKEVDSRVLLKALALYGYAVPTPIDIRIPKNLVTKKEVLSYEENVQLVIRAFQLHFRPTNFSGVADVESEAIALALVHRYKSDSLARRALKG